MPREYPDKKRATPVPPETNRLGPHRPAGRETIRRPPPRPTDKGSDLFPGFTNPPQKRLRYPASNKALQFLIRLPFGTDPLRPFSLKNELHNPYTNDKTIPIICRRMKIISYLFLPPRPTAMPTERSRPATGRTRSGMRTVNGEKTPSPGREECDRAPGLQA